MRSTLQVIASLLVVVSLSCAKPVAESPPASASPISNPVPLPERGTQSILFKGVLFRIPSGTVLGEVRKGRRVIDEMRWTRPKSQTTEFNVGVTDRMLQLGYEMRDASDSLFGPVNASRVQFEMAAILHDVDLDFQYQRTRDPDDLSEGVGTADVRVEVQLHDLVRKKTIYSKTFQGHGEDRGRKPTPIVSAVVDAVAKVASDPDFVSLVANGDNEVESLSNPAQVARVPVCPPDDGRSLPQNLPEVLGSVVEVQIGGVHGSGVVVSPEGYLLTAAHVVGDARDVWVKAPIGPQLPATVLRSSPRYDVALLRVEGRGHPCSRVRESPSDLELGNGVFGINLPIGDMGSQTVSRGVVSGYVEWDDRRFIQTDATANPGASGGPLLDDAGEVVGITVNRLAVEGFEGVGLAVPAPVALEELGIVFED